MMNTAADKVKQWMYYFIIGIISFVALVFLPMVGSAVGLGWNVPDTVVGWIVWVAVKLIVAAINVLIFHSFMQQAKLNVKENTKYKEANEILGKIKIKNYIPRAPRKWNAQQYVKKGSTIFVTSGLATIALTQAILTFDWVAMLTYLFTIIMGLIFGILQMKSAEEYWTDEFYKYALMVKEEQEQEELRLKEEAERALALAEEERNKQTNVYFSNDSRSDILESCVDYSVTCTDYQSLVLDSNRVDYSILGGTVHASSTVADSTGDSSQEDLGENKENLTVVNFIDHGLVSGEKIKETK